MSIKVLDTNGKRAQDAAGESLPRTVANLLPGQDVRYAQWPEGCKDANDVLMAFGEGEVAARLNAAKRIDPPVALDEIIEPTAEREVGL